jgi:glutamyl/glutaminyl-tRNA synthetase
MGAYDLVLGMDWLETFRSMTCDCLQKWIEFEYKNKMIRLLGMLPNHSQELAEVSMEQVLRWDSRNDLWVVVLVEPADKTSPLTEQHMLNGVPSQIKDLIHEFESIFQNPSSLPPVRSYDHAINILLNTIPVNCRPYRYSREQKSEIERQVQTMLKSGIVIPSLSPYASLVLLVKKKDNTWRFCVDYRKLNSITIKKQVSSTHN